MSSIPKEVTIAISTRLDIDALVLIRDHSTSSHAMRALLTLYKECGLNAIKAGFKNSPVVVGEMGNLVGKQAFTENGWVEVLTSLPLANADGWVCTFSDRPDLAYLLDTNGYSRHYPIYSVRDKPCKTKSKKSTETLTTFD